MAREGYPNIERAGRSLTLRRRRAAQHLSASRAGRARGRVSASLDRLRRPLHVGPRRAVGLGDVGEQAPHLARPPRRRSPSPTASRPSRAAWGTRASPSTSSPPPSSIADQLVARVVRARASRRAASRPPARARRRTERVLEHDEAPGDARHLARPPRPGRRSGARRRGRRRRRRTPSANGRVLGRAHDVRLHAGGRVAGRHDAAELAQAARHVAAAGGHVQRRHARPRLAPGDDLVEVVALRVRRGCRGSTRASSSHSFMRLMMPAARPAAPARRRRRGAGRTREGRGRHAPRPSGRSRCSAARAYLPSSASIFLTPSLASSA